jgi:hypothetical protein
MARPVKNHMTCSLKRLTEVLIYIDLVVRTGPRKSTVITTSPFASNVIACSALGIFILAAKRVKVPVPGENVSALSYGTVPMYPPVINTNPSRSSTAA